MMRTILIIAALALLASVVSAADVTDIPAGISTAAVPDYNDMPWNASSSGVASSSAA